MSRLNLPQFLPPPESSLDSVSYRGDARSRIKPLDLSAVRQPHLTADCSNAAADPAPGLATVQSAKSGVLLPAIASFSLPPSISALNLTPNPSQQSLKQQQSKHAALYAAPSQAALVSCNSGPMQSSRLGRAPAQKKSNTAAKEAWQYPMTEASACTAHASNLNVLAGGSWQSIATAASAHEQWVLRRQAARTTQEAEQWGELIVHLPNGAVSVSEQLLQQLPEELQENAQFCAVSKVPLHRTTVAHVLPTIYSHTANAWIFSSDAAYYAEGCKAPGHFDSIAHCHGII